MKTIIVFILVIISFSLIFGGNITNGLVAYYPFNGNANDESGNANHGTVYGAQLTTGKYGNPNSAYFLDGIDDYIEIPDAEIHNPPDQMTVAAWIKIDKLPGEYFAVSKGKEIPYSLGTRLERYWVKFGNESITFVHLYSQTVPDGKWHYIVGTYDGQTAKLYVDGKLEDEKSLSGPLLRDTHPLAIGREAVQLENYFPGTVDEVRIYDRPLKPYEIKELMFDGSIVGHWTFDENQGTIAHDVSGYGNHGYLYGNASWGPGKFGNALYFDGNEDYVIVTDDPTITITTGSFTFVFWAKFFGNYQTDGPFAKWNHPLGGWHLGYGTSTDIIAVEVAGDGIMTRSDAIISLDDGEWHNVISVRDTANRRLKLYVDGTKIADVEDITFDIGAPSDLYFGHDSWDQDGDLHGALDEMLLERRAWTDEEVLQYWLEHTNRPPVAHAGNDTTIEATSCQATSVVLNGFQSFDPDGDSLTFNWYKEDSLIATGETPTVELPLGTSNIYLIVNDGLVDSEPDTVLITIVDTTPPKITASLDTIEAHGHEVEYLIKFNAEDLCDPSPTISGVIELPELNNPDIHYKEKKKKKIKIDLKKNKVKVEAKNPEEFWMEIENDNGISVNDGQIVEMKFKKKNEKYEYEFNSNDELEEIEGHEITLFCVAQDFSGNIDSVRITIVYSDEDEHEDHEEEVDEDRNDLTDAVILDYHLAQNVPNPFNPQTTIQFSIPNSEFVILNIFNVQGQQIRQLVNKVLGAGVHSVVWNGKDNQGNNVPSGMYIYRIRAGKFFEQKKMLLIK